MSNETQWTPGPWRAVNLGEFEWPKIVDSRSLIVAEILKNTWGGASTSANARLIAAAPEMAALLERLLAHYEWGRLRYPDDEHGIVAPDIREMRALVTKIKKGA